MERCSSGKTIFNSKELAEEALIQNHIRNNHRIGAGPIDVYECADCQNWHFTSRGVKNPLLTSPDVQQRIEREQRALDWEYRLK